MLSSYIMKYLTLVTALNMVCSDYKKVEHGMILYIRYIDKRIKTFLLHYIFINKIKKMTIFL